MINKINTKLITKSFTQLLNVHESRWWVNEFHNDRCDWLNNRWFQITKRSSWSSPSWSYVSHKATNVKSTLYIVYVNSCRSCSIIKRFIKASWTLWDHKDTRTVTTYWFPADRKCFAAVKILSAIKNRPLSSKDSMIRAYHSFHNISIDSSRTFIRWNGQIVVMDVSLRKTNLKKVCSQGDCSS